MTMTIESRFHLRHLRSNDNDTHEAVASSPETSHVFT